MAYIKKKHEIKRTKVIHATLALQIFIFLGGQYNMAVFKKQTNNFNITNKNKEGKVIKFFKIYFSKTSLLRICCHFILNNF